MNELSQLDELIESDILEALGEEKASSANDEILIEDLEDEILIEDFDEAPQNEDLVEETTKEEEQSSTTEVQKQSISEVNTHDLAALLSQLLNNKTIEITIKIKD